ncbi:XRCC1 [Acanthosepion pharaonis]|uniref:XRCC1 n=1 Tax=Acanthosepion pharaonis TaxID=158019 RepID=A0A812EV10_ACAPH|nr:XRCC1 [Sepia pharaonis]
MPEIKIQHVVSYSSQDSNNPAENLLKPDGTHKWKCGKVGEKQSSVVLQFEKASIIHSIDIGNDSSAFVEILVGRSSSDKDFQNITYGLSFIKFHSPPENPAASTTSAMATTNDDLTNPQKIGAFFFRKDEDDVKVGSFFARHKEKPESPPLTVVRVGAAGSIILLKEKNFSSFFVKTKNKRKHDMSDDEDGVEEKKSKLSRSETNPASRSTDEEKSYHRHKDEHEKSKHSRDDEKKEKKSAHRDDTKHRDSSNSHHNNSTTSKSLSKNQELSKGAKPFHKIMDGVVFVLSGFQNPFRGELRDKAIEMGAKYRPDWMDGCTHLVCAFANTPKYAQVKGKGKIVTKHWITDCYKQKTLLHWKRYRLVDNESGKDSEDDKTVESSQDLHKTDSQKKETDPDFMPVKQDESQSDEQSEDDTDDEVRRIKEADAKKKSPGKNYDSVPSSSSLGDSTLPLEQSMNEDDAYDIATDVDEDSGSDGELPELPDFLAGKHFFLYGELSEKERHNLTRYIVAYNGELEDYMNEKVDFVITAEPWDDNFDEALTNYPQLTFVRPRWLYKCYENNKRVPYQPHIVTP